MPGDKTGDSQPIRVIAATAVLALPVTVVWATLFPLHPEPDLPDITVELLFVLVTTVVYALVWGLGIRPLRLGGGLFLLGIYMDALADIFLTPAFVDVYICQGLQVIGVGLFAWSTYHHYTRLNRKLAQLHEDLSQMEFRATHDPLTRLPNRLLFRDRLLQSMAHAGRRNLQLAIHYFDLDKLKEVNDTHGHAAGDHLLREIAGRLTGIMRSSDTAARLGGDEFAVIQTDVHTEQDARQLAAKLLAAIEKPVSYNDGRLQTSASIGISLYPQHSENIDDLLGMADTAMYKAKQRRGGQNVLVYDGGDPLSPGDRVQPLS